MTDHPQRDRSAAIGSGRAGMATIDLDRLLDVTVSTTSAPIMVDLHRHIAPSRDLNVFEASWH